MSMNGVDIASYQKDMDITQIEADFVIIKLTQGDYYVNPSFDKQYKQAKAAKKLIGLYHYSNGVKPVTTEVDFLIKAAKPYLGTCIICLDWESNGKTKKSGYNPVFNTTGEVAYVREFMENFHSKTGIWPLLYTSASVTRLRDWSSVAANCKLWLAQYANDKLTGYQENPWRDKKGNGAWKEVAIHQYSPSGTITGYVQTATHKLDMDIAYISKSEWEGLAAGSETTVTVSKVVTPELICDIFAGNYGSGNTRKSRLVKEGYDYNQVQKKVNEVVALSKEVQSLKVKSGDYWDAVVRLVI